MNNALSPALKMAAPDSTLATLIGASGAAVVTGMVIGVDRLLKMRRQWSEGTREIAKDRSDTKSIELILEASKAWQAQFKESVARETRLRRQLAVAEAKMRRLAEQAAQDRDMDRRKIESLTRITEAQSTELDKVKATLGGRRVGDPK